VTRAVDRASIFTERLDCRNDGGGMPIDTRLGESALIGWLTRRRTGAGVLRDVLDRPDTSSNSRISRLGCRFIEFVRREVEEFL